MAKKLSRKKKVMVWLGALWGAFAISLLLFAFSIIAPPAGRTGGFGEPTCVAAGCHNSFPLDSGPGSVTITVPQFYTSGNSFPLSVVVSDPDARRWGFELSARIKEGPQASQQAGNLIPTDSFSQLLSSPSSIQYIGHTMFGTRSGTTGSVSFDFMWQAPDVSVGPVIFHAVGDGSDGSSSPTGDRIYSTSATSQPQQPPPPPPPPVPSVFDGGVVDGASFALHPNPLAPGAIVSIFGTDLTDGSDGSSTFFDSNGKLTTTLAGAQVTFNGIAASLFAAFPTQLNVQIPTELTDVISATVQVTVNGQTSTPRTVFIDPVSPGIFSTNSAGTGQGAILNGPELVQGISSLAAPLGSFPNARPTIAGEVIVIFCTGLGQVNPPLASGIPAGLHRTVTPVTVTIDGVDAAVQFDGMAPGFVGLYQVNAVVPEGTRTADDIPIVLTIGGKDSNLGKTVTIAVGQAGGTSSGGDGGTVPPVDGGAEDSLLDEDEPPDPRDDGYC